MTVIICLFVKEGGALTRPWRERLVMRPWAGKSRAGLRAWAGSSMWVSIEGEGRLMGEEKREQFP